MKIGLLSDTHGFLDPAVFRHFDACDEIWHAGDIGSGHVLDQLAAFRPLRAVYGNIDDRGIRLRTPENLWFEAGGFRIWMTHIGGAPPRYNPAVRPRLAAGETDIFICGHSHILRVVKDPAFHNLLYLNPGAAGIHGFHKVRTLLRFEISDRKIRNMEVVELGPRSVTGYSDTFPG